MKTFLTRFMNKLEPARFFKFCLVGLSGVGVNVGLFFVLTRFFGIYDLISIASSVEASILSNFALNEIWTFRDRARFARGILRRALKYNLVCIGGLAICYGIYVPFTRLFGMYDLLSLLFGIIGATIWNYCMSLMWAWRYAGAG